MARRRSSSTRAPRTSAHRTSAALALVIAANLAVPSVASGWEQRSHLKRANTVTTAASLADQTFDYVIVGGGTAGLVLAARLSENSSVTVAVIEAGLSGDAVPDQVLPPAQAYFGGLASMTSDYDWKYNTVPQSGLGDRSVYWPRGKILGGSSAVNGAYMIRASQVEHDSWAGLVGSAALWGWDRIYPYMKKSEFWTPPSDANIALGNMTLDSSLHGLDGPIHYSYPGFFYPQVSTWMATLGALGVATRDPAGGESFGAFIATSAIDPTAAIPWSRSYSKTGYLDPASERTNLVVLTGFQATKIEFSGTTATGVTFAATPAGASYTVSAAQEVILAAGVIGTPQLLQVSGVGDATLLASLNIPVVVDLPGVGMHVTDHLSGAVSYSCTDAVVFTGDAITTNTTIAAEQLALWKAGDASSLMNSPNDAVAYVDLETLLGAAEATAFIAQLAANQTAAVNAYSTNALVRAGYAATYAAEVTDVYPSKVGQIEILMANTGTYGAYGTDPTIQIQAAVQHPLSRGSVTIVSTSTFDAPLIDPGYLTHPADIQILREGFKFARRVAQTEPLASLLVTELNPSASVQTDAEWDAWIRQSVGTEYHPAGTASMLPLDKGGVVDVELRVYGTSKLRIVDSSVVPIGMSAHMTAPLYGIAENAYAIMMASVTTPDPTSTTTSAGTSSTRSSTSASGTATGSLATGGAGRVVGSGAVAMLVTALFCVV